MTYRHNGHAQVLDNLSDISRDSFCDYDSSLEGESFIHCSRLLSSAVQTTRCYRTFLTRSCARNSTLCNVQAEDAVLIDSFVTDATLNRCVLTDCLVRGNQQAQPRLTSTSLNGVVVEGEVELSNVHLTGNYWIHAGVWSRNPRTMTLEDESGVRVGLTECIDQHCHIGQRCHSIKQWLQVGPRLGRMIGWSDELVAHAALFIESLLSEEEVAA